MTLSAYSCGVTLEQLRIFVAVAECEHVTRAAEALRLTQSAVSAAIAALESRSSVTLFDRVGRRIELNAAGRMFLGEARAVLARAAAAELALSEMSGLKRGTLSVHASQTISSYWLSPRLVAFRRAYPRIGVKLTVGNTAQTAKAVIDGTAELGFVEGRVDDPALQQSTIDQDRLTIVVGANHPWAHEKKRLTEQRLVEGDWVLREPGSGTRSEFEAALSGKGVPPQALKVVLELPTNEAVRAAVEAGAGVTAISELVVEAALRAGTLVAMEFDLPARPFLVLHHRDRYQSKAVQEFLNIITRFAEPQPARVRDHE
jgi:DNA-binding transcriptional LysR family regulator